jgi:hypothetical protein
VLIPFAGNMDFFASRRARLTLSVPSSVVDAITLILANHQNLNVKNLDRS